MRIIHYSYVSFFCCLAAISSFCLIAKTNVLSDDVIDNILLEQSVDEFSDDMVRLIVNTNIFMSNSDSPSVGNIVKNGKYFIHNFGTDNTFIAIFAGNFSMTGTSNAAIGTNALKNNKSGSNNTAAGSDALTNNTDGSGNVGIGSLALQNNMLGSDNTAVGIVALNANVDGNLNTAVGRAALSQNKTGSNNTAIGFSAGLKAIGNSNIFIGSQAGSNVFRGNSNIHIGNTGVPADANTIRIGTTDVHKSCFIQGIFGEIAPVGIPVFVGSTGRLGTQTSSQRFKHHIKCIVNESNTIFKLNPVSFIYNDDESQTIQFGLIAEEVDQIFPELVIRDKNDLPYSVRYEMLPVLLLNEMKKQKETIASQQYEIALQQQNALSQQQDIDMLLQVAETLQAKLQQFMANK